jgi:prepilin-type N-terminal cleavage/methylation domain-containing protein
MKKGVTLVELLVVLCIAGLLAGLAFPRLSGWLDSWSVRAAAAEVASSFALARQAAIARGNFATVFVDSAASAVAVTVGADTILRRLLGTVHGVSLRGNRDSLSYDALGHGYGASNQTIVVTRGAAADSVIVSRLGRVRYRG